MASTLEETKGGKGNDKTKVDRFPVTEVVMSNSERIRSWIELSGYSDSGDNKPVSLFKFNPSRVEDEVFTNLVHANWVRYDDNSVESRSTQFAADLKSQSDCIKLGSSENKT